MKKLLLISTSIIITVILIGCSEQAPSPNYEISPILQTVKDRGKLICGGRVDLAGFGYLDDQGNNIGFDIDLCRAVAAAVLGDPNAIEVLDITADERGPALVNREIDMLARNVTWTSSRDIEWGDFSIVMFYDGQGFMTPVGSDIFNSTDFDGKKVCVTTGTTSIQFLADFFAEQNLDYTPISFSDSNDVYNAYLNGECELITSDLSQLAARRSSFSNPDAHRILPGAISKEPLAPAVPHGDSQWSDIVNLVMMALINAEELGITQNNVEEMKQSDNNTILRLLGQEGDWGYTTIGLAPEAFANAIAAVGNYGEIYNRYMGPEGIAFSLPRDLNNLWTHGGLIYAPPIK